jgi:dephospho-CoA kinase
MVLVIGVTGGICSGKTTITKVLEQQQIYPGLKIINADVLGHQTYQKGANAYNRITEVFGENNVLNPDTKEIDRAKLGNLVFKDTNEMKKLTDIVWPEIRSLILQQIDEITEEEKKSNQLQIIILEAAVLFEAQWNDIPHKIWFIYCDEEVAIDRLLKRNPQLNHEQAKARIDSQMTMMDEKRSFSSRIIANNGQLSPEELEKIVLDSLQDDVREYESKAC